MTEENTTRPAVAGGDMRTNAREGQPSAVVPVIGLTLLALILRLIRLDQQLWYDEMTTLVQSVRQPFAHILTIYTSKNQHLLYSLLARTSILAFGDHIWSLRLPAVLFGLACVPMLYVVARRVTSRREALLAAAMMAVSYHHVWFSQNARGYTGLAFWTLLSTWLFLRGLDEDRTGLWVAYGTALALGMYTHLTMGAVVAGHGLVWLGWIATRARWHRQAPLSKQSLHPLAGFAIAAGLTLALYAPILPQVLHRTVGNSVPLVQSPWTSPVWLLFEAARGLGAGTLLGLAAIGGGALLVLAGVITFFRRNALATFVMVLPGLVTAVALLVVKQNLWPRFFFFSIGFAFLFVVRGGFAAGQVASWLFARERTTGAQWGTAFVVSLFVASLWPLRAAYLYPKQDFQGAMRLVDADRKPGDTVVLAGLAVFPYQSYYGRDWPAVETRAQLDAARSAAGNTWLLYWSPIYVQSRQPEIWNAIHNDFSTVDTFRGTLGDGQIYVCRTRDAARE
jgi:4-amino-4-deoxy-L-arabinose transferase-like glycosyltransferase